MTGTRRGFAPLPHTADLALRLWAPDLAGLLVSGIEGLTSLVTPPEGVEPREARAVRVQADDEEDLLIGLLNESLYLFERERFLACRLEISALQENCLEGTFRGEILDPTRHEVLSLPKAATRHRLAILREGESLVTTVVIDA